MNCYLTQHTALILRLQITICFDTWPISCVEEISKELKLWKWVSTNSSHKKRDWYRHGIINLAERLLKTIESDGLYIEELFYFLSENITNKILCLKMTLLMRQYRYKMIIILHCKRRNLGCSSAEGTSSTANSGTKAAVLPGIE